MMVRPQVLVFSTPFLNRKKALDRGVNGRQTIFGQHNITSQNFTEIRDDHGTCLELSFGG